MLLNTFAITYNFIENFWSLLKRTLKGTYIAVKPFHLQKYVNQTFRFNERKGKDRDRFLALVSGVSSKRLPYKELIGESLSL